MVGLQENGIMAQGILLTGLLPEPSLKFTMGSPAVPVKKGKACVSSVLLAYFMDC